MNWSAFWHMTFVFFVIMDSFGNIPLFVSLLSHYDSAYQRRIIYREMFIAFIAMIVFLFFGQGMFTLLNVDQCSMEIAGGIILFLIAIKLVLANPREEGKLPQKEPFIVPLAIPAIAGPGVLATITLYSGVESNKLLVLFAITIAALATLPVLLLSSFLKQFLGKNGLVACERLMGFIVVLIALQMGLNGFVGAFKKYFSCI